jgi:predicted flap endonuclease-1-like 5' DNA nuclease
MDEGKFQKFLKRGGRSANAVKRVLKYIKEFEAFLSEQRGGLTLDEAKADDLVQFVQQIETTPKTSAKSHLWGIRYYYRFTSNEPMCETAGELRSQRIKKKPFPLSKFRGVNPKYVEALAGGGITNVEQMLDVGRTPSSRKALSEKTGVPLEAVLEFVRLSDLARITGLKNVRARLYHDAGVDSIEVLAGWEPEDLRLMLVDYVERTGFDGIPPTPKEAKNAVTTARNLPKVIEYEPTYT